MKAKRKQKSKRQFNKLTPAEHEAIAVLLEEASEVIQICGKILRHGLHSRHPAGCMANREELEKECGDFLAAINIAEQVGVVSANVIDVFADEKLERIPEWLHHIEVIK